MKIAVSSSGNNLDSQIDPRFGRCAYFVVVDSENMAVQVFDNESIALGGGAGIQAAQFVASKGAKAILTGNVGPNAMKTLSAAGVEVFVGQNGTVGEAIARYKRGDLQSTGTANVADHYGMGSAKSGGGAGGSVGMAGGGRGMGGGGRGMGGCGRGMRAAGSSINGSTSDGDEVRRLKDQVRQLQDQLESLESKLMKREA
ncbi:dinitrogenase iron-molybdenum cofactor [delta proteobacterium NaphS2]|nr:dinitrogenase iron-molybdenum cofactor [delta proteobacterium NaphS2]